MTSFDAFLQQPIIEMDLLFNFWTETQGGENVCPGFPFKRFEKHEKIQ